MNNYQVTVNATNKQFNGVFTFDTIKATINKAYKHFRKYHNFVNLDGTFETDKQQATNDRKQAKQYELYEDTFNELPQREQLSFNKYHKELHGYS